MSKKYDLIPVRQDNYIYILINEDNQEALIVDPAENTPVNQFFEKHQNYKPCAILLTHHHEDHIGGSQELQKKWEIPIYAPIKAQREIPFANHYVLDSQELEVSGFHFKILEVPGHTKSHIAYFEKIEQWLLSGDVVFSMGCGRVFDGSIEQHFQSLQKIRNLPHQTLVFCTHEYTLRNIEFCEQVDKNLSQTEDFLEYKCWVQKQRNLSRPSVPTPLGVEIQLNPFLRTSDFEEFKKLRQLRDQF